MANTPSTTFPSSISTPPGAGCDLIYSDTAMPNSIVNGQWVGSDGNYQTSFASAGMFDLRAYRIIHIAWGMSAITGGTAPVGTLLFMRLLDKSESAGFVQMQPTVTIPAAGGPCEMYVGEINPSSAMQVNGSYSSNPGGFVGRVEFAKVGFSFTGAPTGITNGRLYVWGYR